MQLDALERWVKSVTRGETPPEDLDPGVAEILKPLADAYLSKSRKVADLQSYLGEISSLFLEFSSGNFDLEAPLNGNDHTDAVSLGLNMMVEELHAMTEQLGEARDLALAANEAKSLFLANMSHELRTPLNAIIGYAELIEDEISMQDDADQEVLADIGKILRAARHLLQLISDVLDLSKVEAGKMELAPEQIDVGGLLHDVTDTARALMMAHDNELEIDIRSLPVGSIVVDGLKLRQTLMNLLGNAAKFTKNGRITLTVETREEQLRCVVTDTGIGISPDRIEAIFDPFTQEKSSTTREHGGTGLGLAICKRFIELMGGELGVRSKVGAGTSFHFYVPFENAKSDTVPPAPVRVAESNRTTVMVIDDDNDAYELIRRHVEPMRCEVVWVSDGQDAVEQARQLQPALITLDVFMPGQDGWTLLSQLKSDPATTEIPVVMVTIHQGAERALALGASDYLLKPVDKGRLLRLVAEHVGHERPQVLVVDDDRDARAVLQRLLEGAGYEVQVAIDGLHALERLNAFTPDLILLDLMMPRMDGFDVVHTLQQDPAFDIPIVVLTAMTLDAADRERLQLSSRSILTKGRDLRLVLSRMEALLQ